MTGHLEFALQAGGAQRTRPPEPGRRPMKRTFDLLFVLATLPLWLPALALLALAVRIGLGSPVLFRQARVGRYGRIFRLWKFRSMSSARDAAARRC